MTESNPNLLELRETDRLLDELGARRTTGALSVPDPVLDALASWASEVDTEPLPSLPATRVERARTVARRTSRARHLGAVLALGLTVSSTGVAAAVTGDPLMPFKAVVRHFAEVNRDPGPHSDWILGEPVQRHLPVEPMDDASREQSARTAQFPANSVPSRGRSILAHGSPRPGTGRHGGHPSSSDSGPAPARPAGPAGSYRPVHPGPDVPPASQQPTPSSNAPSTPPTTTEPTVDPNGTRHRPGGGGHTCPTTPPGGQPPGEPGCSTPQPSTPTPTGETPDTGGASTATELPGGIIPTP